MFFHFVSLLKQDKFLKNILVPQKLNHCRKFPQLLSLQIKTDIFVWLNKKIKSYYYYFIYHYLPFLSPWTTNENYWKLSNVYLCVVKLEFYIFYELFYCLKRITWLIKVKRNIVYLLLQPNFWVEFLLIIIGVSGCRKSAHDISVAIKYAVWVIFWKRNWKFYNIQNPCFSTLV